MRRRGFTLIELVVVMTIVSLLITALSFRLLGPWTSASQQSDLLIIRSMDQFARRQAQQIGAATELRIDRETGTLTASQPSAGTVLKNNRLSAYTQIVELVSAMGAKNEGESREEINVIISSLGTSLPYAIKLDQNGKERWILITGVAGQFQIDVRESEVKRFFDMFGEK